MAYPAVAGSALYGAASSDKNARPGDEYQFNTDEGMVKARYLQNKQGASIAAGFVVGWDIEPNAFNTDHVASSLCHPNLIAGVLMTSVTTDDYAWVAFHGPVTQGLLAETYDSTTVVDFLTVTAAGHLGTMLSSVAEAAVAEGLKGIGVRRTTGATAASGSGNGAVIQLLWK